MGKNALEKVSKTHLKVIYYSFFKNVFAFVMAFSMPESIIHLNVE
jgi:hypothetical protein